MLVVRYRYFSSGILELSLGTVKKFLRSSRISALGSFKSQNESALNRVLFLENPMNNEKMPDFAKR